MSIAPSASEWFEDPLWFKDAIIYELHVRAFCDGNGDGIGDFPGLCSKLDYLQELGVNTIWLLPFYPSPMKDDGYDIADYRGVHPDYGTLRDFRRFVREAHRRGLKVITELVINHTSDQHPWFQAARRAPRGSAARDFYVWSDSDRKFADTRIIFTDTESSNWAWDPVAGQYYWHRFFSHQPDLNHDNPQVVKAVIRVMRFWLDAGVDGLRLDAIPYLCVQEGTSNENLPQTHEVIRQMRAVVDTHYSNRMLLAEANQWPEDVREYFGDGDECHMAYHFPLMPRIYMAIALEDRYPITEILAQTPEIPDKCQWAIFLRNHDELTLEMVTDSERDYMYRMYGYDPRMRINVGIRRRLAPLLDNDHDRIKLMNSLLLSMPGSPILYYGDEIGMGDNVYLGDRDSVRTPMQWSPDRNSGFSRADPQRLYLPVVMDPVYGYEAVNVEAQSRDSWSLLNWTKRILSVRRQHHAFGRGTLEIIRPRNRKILAYVREHEGEIVLCVANLARTAQAVELDLQRYRGRVPVELTGQNPFPPIGELPYLLTLPGQGFFWLRLAEPDKAPAWHVEWLPASELPVLVLIDGLRSFVTGSQSGSDRDIAGRALRQLEQGVLPHYLQARRWFAGQGSQITRIDLGARGTWHTPVGDWMLAMPRVSLADGGEQQYFLPLAIGWEGLDDDWQHRTAAWSLAKVREKAAAGYLVDAFGDQRFYRALVKAIGEGAVIPFGEGELRFETTGAYGRLTASALDSVECLTGEHGSSGAVIDDTLFLKGYRRLRAGVHPDIEMGRYLTEVAGYANAATLAGSVNYVPASGEPVVLASLFGFAHNQGDARTWTLDHLERQVTVLIEQTTASQDDPHALYVAQIETLGRRVGELHAALARPADDAAFAPEPITSTDLRHWSRDALRDAKQSLRQLQDALPLLPEPVRGSASRLLGRRAALLERLRKLADDVPDLRATRTRIHGDLHLGQVLVVRDDFVLIDFASDAGRSFEERRRKHSALRDVGSMLRSFDRSRAVVLERAVARRPDAIDRVAASLDAWKQSTRAAFLKGYLAGAGGASCLPKARRDTARLIEFFELQNALGELSRELEREPARLGVPIDGILDILAKGERGSPRLS
jgi:maltose alpha-D-glucosyltransferase / alpha-amylase